MAKYQLEITSNGGYSPDQVCGIKVRHLKALLEDYNDDDEIVLHDEGNRHGASFGYMSGEINECESEE